MADAAILKTCEKALHCRLVGFDPISMKFDLQTEQHIRS